MYDKSIEGNIRDLVGVKAKELNVKVKILESDFEGMFKNKYLELSNVSQKLYGQNKILQGYYLANNISKENIPIQIKELIDELKEL